MWLNRLVFLGIRSVLRRLRLRLTPSSEQLATAMTRLLVCIDCVEVRRCVIGEVHADSRLLNPSAVRATPAAAAVQVIPWSGLEETNVEEPAHSDESENPESLLRTV
jgi:hypothetical protein